MKNTVRTVYLYIFALLGLVLVIIGSVGLINMALKATIFTGADIDYYSSMPPQPYGFERVKAIENSSDFTEEEKAAARAWLDEYAAWNERSDKFDYANAERQRSAAQNIAMIIVGLPLYLFHWRIIRREN